jgi:hypothetical protein
MKAKHVNITSMVIKFEVLLQIQSLQVPHSSEIHPTVILLKQKDSTTSSVQAHLANMGTLSSEDTIVAGRFSTHSERKLIVM